MSISPITENLSPAKTLRGFPVPTELVESIRRQEEGRKEIKDRITVVQKCFMQKPADEKGKAELNSAIRWLGENAERMDDAQKLGAFFPIARLAEEGCGCVDPLEAGLAMGTIAKKLEILDSIFEIIRTTLNYKMKGVINREMLNETYATIYHVLLAAGAGDPEAVRIAMFWERVGRAPGAEGRIESVHPEVVKSIRKDIEEGAKSSARG